jgi:hypothetical protein
LKVRVVEEEQGSEVGRVSTVGAPGVDHDASPEKLVGGDSPCVKKIGEERGEIEFSGEFERETRSKHQSKRYGSNTRQIVPTLSQPKNGYVHTMRKHQASLPLNY